MNSPFTVTLLMPGLRVDYTLASEHLERVWDALEEARKLDDAKEKLAKAVSNAESSALADPAGWSSRD